MKVIEVISFCFILIGSAVFGLMGKPAEMALAIVAGALTFSLANLDKFEKLRAGAFEAHIREKIEALTESRTEPILPPDRSSLQTEFKSLDPIIQEVAHSLLHPEYTWRYIRGIEKETDLSKVVIEKALQWLSENLYARKSQGKHGQIWSLTEEGRTFVIASEFDDVSGKS